MKSLFTRLKMLKTVIPALLIILLASSCFKDHPIIPPKAEITRIYDITEHSAVFEIKVTGHSNAQSEILNYRVDSISLNQTKIEVQFIYFTHGVRRLNDSYTDTITNLSGQTTYTITLVYNGYFDIGGPNEWKSFTLGKAQSFTTK
ncbi:MAG: hypothetical protein HC830_03850 [Bacteroidetes bacterium]|nr:hypothetical protein [Bacteroidota bacterium]